MATKKDAKKAAPAAKGKATADDAAKAKAEKRKARMEAIKNRPAEQRTNSKQIDVIEVGGKTVVKSYGYPVKAKGKSIGVMVTTVVLENGVAVSTSTTFIPGAITVKVKKGHGMIVAQKRKGEVDDEDGDDQEPEEENED